ncbi:hypothetical protein PCANC_10476 [Puccinia coronata f. sp. avenae]|uniref:Uncharacterized protein n=1 Tax=Puccinia coronata f. sp. avenae TaxID=200324 RepID=A0A2N5VI98_9BASI|nr:hypothetical protein PCANC_22603 [Puccinia coronata f. sp. avenae]PLW20289.1 hypothetical protein PCASD_19740 [Puccinia coronata f. sp. avenae]PLW49723.1 hypothetical protein PCANC_10476 [Puccinia coronata f. sp. avenae]
MKADKNHPTAPSWKLEPNLSEHSDPASPLSLDFTTDNFHTATTDLPSLHISAVPINTSTSRPTLHSTTLAMSSPLRPSAAANPGGGHLYNLASPPPPSSDLHIRTPPETPSAQAGSSFILKKNASQPASLPDLTIRCHAPPQRLSILRQGGTASVLDLASLVRSARDRAHESAESIASPPLYNYYAATSSFDLPPPRASLGDLTDDRRSLRSLSREPTSPLARQSFGQAQQTPSRRLIPHLDGVPENSLPPDSGQARPSQKPAARPFFGLFSSSSVHLPSVEKRNSIEVTASQTRQHAVEPQLSSIPLCHAGANPALLRTIDLSEELQVTAMSSCLPMSTDRRRSLSKTRTPQRRKSQSGSLHGFWALGSHENVSECFTDASLHSHPPPQIRPRLRSFSGLTSSDPSPPAPALVRVSACCPSPFLYTCPVTLPHARHPAAVLQTRVFMSSSKGPQLSASMFLLDTHLLLPQPSERH